jgi:hypothetical protein
MKPGTNKKAAPATTATERMAETTNFRRIGFS